MQLGIQALHAQQQQSYRLCSNKNTQYTENLRTELSAPDKMSSNNAEELTRLAEHAMRVMQQMKYQPTIYSLSDYDRPCDGPVEYRDITPTASNSIMITRLALNLLSSDEEELDEESSSESEESKESEESEQESEASEASISEDETENTSTEDESEDASGASSSEYETANTGVEHESDEASEASSSEYETEDPSMEYEFEEASEASSSDNETEDANMEEDEAIINSVQNIGAGFNLSDISSHDDDDDDDKDMDTEPSPEPEPTAENPIVELAPLDL